MPPQVPSISGKSALSSTAKFSSQNLGTLNMHIQKHVVFNFESSMTGDGQPAVQSGEGCRAGACS